MSSSPTGPDTPRVPPSADPDVDFVIETYLHHAERAVAPNTFKRNKQHIEEFRHTVRGKKLCELKPYHLVTWIESHPNWKKNSTLAHACNAVRGCFTWAHRMGMTATDPFRGVRYVSHDTRKPITTAEHEALLARTNDSNFTDLLIFLWESGMRPDELCRMEWSWIRYDLDAIVFEVHKTRKKTGLAREIPLTDKMREVLVRCKNRRPDSQLVFMTQTGRKWVVSNSLAQKFRRARERAKLRSDLTLYCYRHSEATRLLASGVPDIITARILGHADTRMLRRYAHPQLSMLREAMMRASSQSLI